MTILIVTYMGVDVRTLKTIETFTTCAQSLVRGVTSCVRTYVHS